MGAYLRGVSFSNTDYSTLSTLYGSSGAGKLRPSPIEITRSYYNTIDDLAGSVNTGDISAKNDGSKLFVSMKSKTKNTSGSTITALYTSVWGGSYDTLLNNAADNLLALNYPGIRFCYQHEIDAATAKNAGTDLDAMKAYIHVIDRFEARRVLAGKAAGYFIYVITYASYGIGTLHNGVLDLANGLGKAGTLYPDYGTVNRPDTVTEIGYDPYNSCGTGGSGLPPDYSKWHSLAYNTQVALDFGTLKGKPVCLPEWNSLEDPSQPGRKAAWLVDADAWITQNAGKGAGQFTATMYYNQALKSTTQSYKIVNATSQTIAELQTIFQKTFTTRTPNAPTSPTNSNITISAVTLHWVEPTQYTNGDPLTGIQGYHVYVDGSSTPAVVTTGGGILIPAGTTSKVMSGFAPGSVHTFLIKTVAGDGTESAAANFPSVTFLASTDTHAPPPGNLTDSMVFAPSPGQVNINLPVVVDPTFAGQTTSGFSHFDVYRATDAALTTRVKIGSTAHPSDLIFADTTVAIGTGYWYDLISFDVAGNFSAHGTVGHVTTPLSIDLNPPTQPTSLEVVPGSDGVSAVINWGASTDDSGGPVVYSVLFGPIGEIPTFVDSTTDTAYTVTDLDPGQSYLADVLATDSLGNTTSRSSNPPTVTMPSVDGPIYLGVTTVPIPGADQALTITINASTGGAGPLVYTITSWDKESFEPMAPISFNTPVIPHYFGDYGNFTITGYITDLSSGRRVTFEASVLVADPLGDTTSRGWWMPQRNQDIVASDWRGVLRTVNDEVVDINSGVTGFTENYKNDELLSMPRTRLGTAPTLTSGKLKMKFTKLLQDWPITQLRSTLATAATSTTIFKFCVAILDPVADTAVIVGLTSNDTAWANAGGDPPSTFEQLTSMSATYQDDQGNLLLPKGAIVGFGALWYSSGAGTAPTIIGSGGGGQMEMDKFPRGAGTIIGLTDMPALNSTLSGWATASPDTTPVHVYVAASQGGA